MWVTTWGCAMYYGDDTGDEGKASALRISKTLKNATLRQIIRTSIGGEKLRLTFSNEYGQTTMSLKDVHIASSAVPGASDIDTKTDTAVTFNGGSKSADIPAGERLRTDPITFQVSPIERIAVSVCFGEVPESVACHVGARANSFVVPGNAVSEKALTGADINTHWFALAGADVEAPGTASSIVILGDSITDGYGVAEEQYTRWTDVLAERLQKDSQTRHIGIVNMGIGTNHLLEQENPSAAIKRFERDVLKQTGVGYLIFLIGVNDLAFSDAKAGEMIKAYEQMIAAARERGIKVYPCTITPYSTEATRRHDVNNWLRSFNRKGQMDGLIDFDELLRDPEKPDFMQPKFDNDGLHPSIEAYKAMGELTFKVLTDTIKRS